MKNDIEVSVIVPVYNVEKYLRKCLDSLVKQTMDNIEIIVVDDGSTDQSSEIIKEFKEAHPDKIVS
ncbi:MULTISPECIES: glycosyltransferase family 2 protein, partial [unclassified Paenibacillus]|uniref:glycosyltransferase family 2 protein n=1 Tax=unclassified Paenibacillus TaxID=185978 RepID=UPI0038355C57